MSDPHRGRGPGPRTLDRAPTGTSSQGRAPPRPRAVRGGCGVRHRGDGRRSAGKGPARLLGPATQGPPKPPLIYLAVGTYTGQRASSWGGRIPICRERRLARFHALDAESCRRCIGDPEDPLSALRAASCRQSLAVYPGKVQVGSIRRQLDALCRSRRLHHFPTGLAQWRWRRARSMQRQLQAGGHGRDRDELPVHDHVAGNILPVGLPRPP